MVDNRILHRIELEGAEDVANKLKKAGDIGEESSKRIQRAFEAANRASAGFGEGAAALQSSTEGSRLAAERFRETIHVLHPILESAGLGISNLGGYARLAGAGFGALGAAIVGSVLIGLAKLADQAAATKKQLDDISSGQGGAHFAGLREDAERLGTDVESLIPAYKQLLGLRNDLNAGNRNVIFAPGHEPFNQPGGPLSNENLRSANSAVQSLFKAGKAEDPAKATADFFEEIRKSGGRLTPQALQVAAGHSEGAANEIARSLPEGFATYQQAISSLQSGRQIGVDELFLSIGQIAPEAEKSAKAVRGLKEAIDGAEGSVKELAKSAAGENLGKNVAAVLDKFSSGVGQLAHLNENPADTSKNFGNIGLPILLPGLGGFVKRLVPDQPGASAPSPQPASAPSSIIDFLISALTNPGALQERPRDDISPTDQPAPAAQSGSAEITDAIDKSREQTTSLLGNILGAIVGFLSGAKPTVSDTNTTALGVRGATGGHIRGPGTSTSDSIPAYLSDGEFVVNAKAVRDFGVDRLEAINKGAAHFAAGGLADAGVDDFRGNLSITYDPNTGGAYINGNLYPPGSPILDDPRIKAAIERSKASTQASGPVSGHSDSVFGGNVGGFAEGGLVGDRVAAFRQKLTAMGFANGGLIDVPHLALGGFPEFDLPDIDTNSLSDVHSSPGPLHPVTLNLPGGGRVDGVFARPDAVKQLQRAAIDDQTFATGKKPSWYGSRG